VATPSELPRRAWLTAAALSAVVLPLTIQAHELGHLSAYVLFGLPEPTLDYASTGFGDQPEFWRRLQAGDVTGARALANIGYTGVAALLGPLVTYVLIGLGLASLARTGRLVGAAVAVCAAARLPLILAAVLVSGGVHTDEAHVSQALLVPMWTMTTVTALALCIALGGTWTLLARTGRQKLTVALGVGAAAGAGVWMGWLGPLLFG
jgi:hypothetical protein